MRREKIDAELSAWEALWRDFERFERVILAAFRGSCSIPEKFLVRGAGKTPGVRVKHVRR